MNLQELFQALSEQLKTDTLVKNRELFQNEEILRWSETPSNPGLTIGQFVVIVSNGFNAKITINSNGQRIDCEYKEDANTIIDAQTIEVIDGNILLDDPDLLTNPPEIMANVQELSDQILNRLLSRAGII